MYDRVEWEIIHEGWAVKLSFIGWGRAWAVKHSAGRFRLSSSVVYTEKSMGTNILSIGIPVGVSVDKR